MIKRIYISGPITGIAELNKPAFDDAAAKLRAAGFEPINPHENGLPPDAAWHDHMRADIALLMGADAVALLSGWEFSKGADLEVTIAGALKMPVNYVQSYIDGAA